MYKELMKYSGENRHLTTVRVDYPHISVQLTPQYPKSDIPPYGRYPCSIAVRNFRDLKSIDIFYSFTYHFQTPTAEEQQAAAQQRRAPRPSFNPAFGLPVIALAAKFGPNEQPFHLGGDVLHLACPLAEEKEIQQFADSLLLWEDCTRGEAKIGEDIARQDTFVFCTPRNFSEFIITSHEDHIPEFLSDTVNIDVLRNAFNNGFELDDAHLDIPGTGILPINREPE